APLYRRPDPVPVRKASASAWGGLVGVVHETQLLAAWGADPLAQVSDVMARVRKTQLRSNERRRIHQARLAARPTRRQKLF
ncbi:hypothetical protein D7Y13_39560, partial [Corallococcus praedator]